MRAGVAEMRFEMEQELKNSIILSAKKLIDKKERVKFDSDKLKGWINMSQSNEISGSLQIDYTKPSNDKPLNYCIGFYANVIGEEVNIRNFFVQEEVCRIFNGKVPCHSTLPDEEIELRQKVMKELNEVLKTIAVALYQNHHAIPSSCPRRRRD